MVYDKENRLVRHQEGVTVATMTFDGDGLKRTERKGGVSPSLVTLMWDGSDYLGAKS